MCHLRRAFQIFTSVYFLSYGLFSYAIVGGETNEEFKNIVSIRGISLCGGTIINPYIVITAAHCTHDGRVELSISSPETQKTYKVKKVIPHPSAKFHSSQSTLLEGQDISIIVLDSPVEIPLDAIIPLASKRDIKLKENHPLKVVGAGIDESGWPSGVFKSAVTTISKIPKWKCGGNDKNTFSTKHVVRTGDSGGPAYSSTSSGKKVQVGVISREIIFDYMNEYLPVEKQKKSECENKSIYTDVSDYLPWISEITGYDPAGDQTELTKKIIKKFEISTQQNCDSISVLSTQAEELIKDLEKTYKNDLKK